MKATAAIAALVCAGVGVAALAQQQPSPPPRFKDTVTVERLVVDVRVVDASGQPVLGLGAEDFKHAVKFNPNFAPASEALVQLQNGTFKPPLTP